LRAVGLPARHLCAGARSDFAEVVRKQLFVDAGSLILELFASLKRALLKKTKRPTTLDRSG